MYCNYFFHVFINIFYISNKLKVQKKIYFGYVSITVFTLVLEESMNESHLEE